MTQAGRQGSLATTTDPVAPDQELIEAVRQLFVQRLNMEAPAPDLDLIESGRLDSLALVELIFAIEQEFGVDASLGELDIENFRNVERIAGFVAGRLEAKGAAPAD
jgi:acyl carrier protein